MSSDNSLVIMKLPRYPGIVIAQQDDFIVIAIFKDDWRNLKRLKTELFCTWVFDHWNFDTTINESGKLTCWWSIRHNGITNHENMSFIIWMKYYRIIILINECIIRIPSICGFNRRNGVDSLDLINVMDILYNDGTKDLSEI